MFFPLTLTVSGLARFLAEIGSSIETQFLARCSPSVEQASHCFGLFVSLSYTCFEYPSNIQYRTSFEFDEHTPSSGELLQHPERSDI